MRILVCYLSNYREAKLLITMVGGFTRKKQTNRKTEYLLTFRIVSLYAAQAKTK